MDECEINNGNCEQLCNNTHGSFTCYCDEGFESNGSLCHGNNTYIVHFYMMTICYHLEDIDECSEGIDTCASNATCTNTEGNYNCSCDTGYHGDGFYCESKLTHKYVCVCMHLCMFVI